MAKISKKDRQSIVEALQSTDENVALKAVEKLKKRGDASFIPDLLDTLKRTDKASIENAIAQLLYDLKDRQALETLVDHLNDPAYSDIQVIMLSACWQSGIDLSHRLPDFITAACTGSYLECLEVLTIVENWDAVTDQNMLTNELLRLKTFVSESDTPENDDMIFSIMEVLEKFVQQ